MATLKKNLLDITGSVGEISIYRRRGVEKTIVRQKGGPSADQIKHSPKFKLLRHHQAEFKGFTLACKHLRLTFHELRALSCGFNVSAPLNRLMKIVQKQDTSSALGTRNVNLSRYPDLLRGLPLNKSNVFDAVFCATLTWSLDRDTRSVRVHIPQLVHGVNFHPQNDLPLFSVVISLGLAPDFVYDPGRKTYRPPVWYGTNNGSGARTAATPWYSATKGCSPSTLEIQLDPIPDDEAYTLVLAIGIRFGIPYGENIVEEAKYTGAAKILDAAGV
ncbi:hypothetical protein KK062_27275 [Fulvivirgaceae bacterium PWU5]|uniref:Uncharacterized protein n=1 Tax=Dawidia cretensis TaxID=2782350 RepID=A0AAP2GW99_9BACT|nr:hypothetical protein [Dawidia cretensis]MBT1711975.1 hypothetical protein [Dawidia cretensis]